MKKENEYRNVLTFLGTGGGSNVTYSQARATGGLHLILDEIPILIDPGPGSLVWLRKMKLKDPELLLLSHLHIDHSNDVNAILDGMRNPRIIAEKHCLEYSEKYYPCVSKYHQSIAKFIRAVEGGELIYGDEMNLQKNSIKIFVTKSEHHAPCVGFKIVGSKTIGYTSDGIYYKDQEKNFENCDLIIFNVLIPYGTERNNSEKKHMSVSDVINFLNSMKSDAKPKVAILQHFSFTMMKHNVYKQAKIVEEKTGIRSIAAKDFMQIDLDSFEILKTKKDFGLEKFI
ncbi:MAG: MBL fold metallo-hydrolase [Candidatus Aenigmatarchaeota archaeon]